MESRSRFSANLDLQVDRQDQHHDGDRMRTDVIAHRPNTKYMSYAENQVRKDIRDALIVGTRKACDTSSQIFDQPEKEREFEERQGSEKTTGGHSGS